MADVAVVTDSTSYLPPELLDRHGIQVVPLYVVFGGDRTVREVDITDYPAFFEELRAAETLPTTSQPSVGDFTAVYEPLLAEGKEVVSVHISGGLSGTPEAARQAKAALERDGKGGERIEVVDSTTAAGGLGFMVLAAAKAAAPAPTPAEVAVQVAEARRELKMWFVIDTLEFLKRGGRIGAASAWIGSTLRGQADPDRRERDDPGRTGAPRGRSSAWSTTRASATTPARTPGPPSTSTRPTSAGG